MAGQVEFGVFKALVDANQQQLHSYVELIQNVAASTAGFADANVGLVGARRWLVERFPGSFTVEGESDGVRAKPVGPHHWAKWLGEEKESKTRSRGASKRRDAEISGTSVGIETWDLSDISLVSQ